MQIWSNWKKSSRNKHCEKLIGFETIESNGSQNISLNHVKKNSEVIKIIFFHGLLRFKDIKIEKNDKI